MLETVWQMSVYTQAYINIYQKKKGIIHNEGFWIRW